MSQQVVEDRLLEMGLDSDIISRALHWYAREHTGYARQKAVDALAVVNPGAYRALVELEHDEALRLLKSPALGWRRYNEEPMPERTYEWRAEYRGEFPAAAPATASEEVSVTLGDWSRQRQMKGPPPAFIHRPGRQRYK